MTAIPGPRPISGMTILTLPASARRVTAPKTYAEMMKREEELVRQGREIREGSAKRIAEQRAIKVHTVYKVDGKVVGIVHRNGWTTFSGSGLGGIAEVHETAGRLGRTGDALNDMLAKHSTARLRSLYGSRLQVESYPDATDAPTSGEVEDLMFGRAKAATRLSRVV